MVFGVVLITLLPPLIDSPHSSSACSKQTVSQLLHRSEITILFTTLRPLGQVNEYITLHMRKKIKTINNL